MARRLGWDGVLLITILFLTIGVVGAAHFGGIDQPSPTQTPDREVTPTPADEDTFPAVSDIERAIHDAVNAYRTERGLETLSSDSALVAIAREHSKDMHEREFFDHDNPDSEGPEHRVGDHCVAVGENLAINYWDRPFTDGSRHTSVEALADDVLDMWIESPGHRENLERAEFGRQGIGIYLDTDSNRVYVTQKLCPAE